MRKKSAVFQISNVWCFFKSSGPVCKHLHFNLIKMHPNFFSTKNVDFYIFEPKKCKMNENYPETSLKWSIVKLMIRLTIIQYHWCLSQKKHEFEKCSFIRLLKCKYKCSS